MTVSCSWTGTNSEVHITTGFHTSEKAFFHRYNRHDTLIRKELMKSMGLFEEEETWTPWKSLELVHECKLNVVNAKHLLPAATAWSLWSYMDLALAGSPVGSTGRLVQLTAPSGEHVHPLNSHAATAIKADKNTPTRVLFQPNPGIFCCTLLQAVKGCMHSQHYSHCPSEIRKICNSSLHWLSSWGCKQHKSRHFCPVQWQKSTWSYAAPQHFYSNIRDSKRQIKEEAINSTFS